MSWNTYIILLKKFDEFDDRFRLLPVKIYRPRNTCRRYVFVLPIITITTLLIFQNLRIFVKFGFSKDAESLFYILTEALIHVLRILQISLYVFTCDEMSLRFSHLQRSWASYLKYLSDTKASPPGVYLENYRLLNLHLLSCTRLMDKFFWLRLALLLLNCFPDTLYDLSLIHI